jgi:hypothetical protein
MEQEIPIRYVNQAQFYMGVYDFTIDFSHVVDPRSTPPRAELVSRVQMSPQHAKVVALALLKHLAAYEHKMGIIELPAALLEELKLANLQHFISQVNLHE